VESQLANRKSAIENRKSCRGCSSMVERQLPKLDTRVRFPSPAISFLHLAFDVGRSVFGVFFDESSSKHRTLNVEHPMSNSD
jgi:hypothetical protein